MITTNTRVYLENSKRLIPLKNKIPVLKNWVQAHLSRDELERYDDKEYNFGWALDHEDLVIDIDPRNGGKESFKKLQEDLGLKFIPTVKTPNGYHVYLTKPKDIKIKKTVKKYSGIDFLSYGTQCLIAGSKIDNKPYEWYDIINEFETTEAPKELLEVIGDKNQEVLIKDDFDDLSDIQILAKNESYNYSDIDIENLLYKIDPDCDYDKWIKLGMSLYSWDKTKGYELWNRWSKGGLNYDAEVMFNHWKSFADVKSISLGTLTYYANEAVRETIELDMQKMKDNILLCETKDDIERIVTKINRYGFDDINKEILVKCIQEQYKKLFDIKVPIKEVRKKLSNGSYNMQGGQWFNNWIYVNSHNAYLNVQTLQLHKTESFNIENGKYIPENENGGKPSASRYIADNGLIVKVDSIAYLPDCEDSVVNFDNKKVFNTFNNSSIPDTAEQYTESGLQFIELVKKHISLICNNDQANINVLTQWLAHQIQFPGKKILWSPIIQSIQGVGKSFFGELLRACLGDTNVGTINPTQVTSQFNGWSSGTAVSVLEELRIVGHNRFEVINALKPLITDRVIQINEKGVKQFVTYNTTNYICFTNYKDAIPVENDDRRWWVLFVDIKNLKDIELVMNMPLNDYFILLFDGLRKYKDEVRKWMLDYNIDSEFIKTKQAPNTSYKESMIETEDSIVEGYLEAKELLESGSRYYNNECLDSGSFFEDLRGLHSDLYLNNHQKNKILKKLGFTLCKNRTKIDGKLRKVWSTKSLSYLQILNHFDELEQNYKTKNLSKDVLGGGYQEELPF